MAPTMRAVRLSEFGGPEVLHTDRVPVPSAGRGEVLVAVHAVGLNPPDWYLREGMPDVPADLRPPMDLPLIPGTDVSGVVTALGEGVTDLAVGDEVFGMLRFPEPMNADAYAEYVVAPVEDLARKPASLDHAHAAALPMAGLTAWQFLIDLGHDHPSPFQDAAHRPVPLGPGTTVLVNGAAGGVGHLAVQLAVWQGAHVTAVASGRHRRFLLDLGAQEVIDYTEQRPEEAVGEVDLVLDVVGGPESRRFLPAVRRGGSIFPVYLARYDTDEVAARGITATATQVRANGAQLAQLAGLVDAGTVRPAIDASFELADAAEAHARAAQGHIQGKIVLTVADGTSTSSPST
ncbi:NADP-dependent oxidoreductase [Actinomycetospora termitidis]|uniref:NADP-dependent oxidoreductase n=1 Tax=Actinomycetospora termitidis TaxID=3053470 RepID=A0ABT7MGF6_9PSEU|nr:NADP-dependent oxidoreductase [Actinomycetospora sp. Odt1-22]MDL5159751.1 NADP-dependent oxidoreductase [Actinomycetospora sp. Odt1-22]